MGSHLWALSSPTFISLPATSLGRSKLRAALASSRPLPPAASRHPPGPAPAAKPPAPRHGDRRAAASVPRQAEIKRQQPRRGFSPRKGGSPHSKCREITWQREHQPTGKAAGTVLCRQDMALLPLGSRRAHPPLRNTEHPSLAGAHTHPWPSPREIRHLVPAPAKHPARGHRASPETPMAGWLARRPSPAELQGKPSPFRRGRSAGRTWAGPVSGTCRVPGLLLRPALPSLRS